MPVAPLSRTSRISASPRYRAVRPDGRTGDGCLEFVAESLRAFAVPAGALDHGTPKELNSQLDSIIRPRSALERATRRTPVTGSSSLTLIGTLLPTVKRKLLSVVSGSVGMFPLLIVHLQSSSDDRAVATGHRGLQSEDRKLFAQRERPRQARRTDRKLNRERRRAAVQGSLVFMLHFSSDMLKLLGSYALAKLLGFGLVGAIVIYALLSLLT